MGATQFFEFVRTIADSATDGNTVHLSRDAAIQPIAAQDVATAVTRATVNNAVNGILNVAGPEKFSMDDFVQIDLVAYGDPRQVVADPTARYFGAVPDEDSIIPGENEAAVIYPIRFTD